MELYQVEIEYRDVSGEEAWEQSLGQSHRVPMPRPEPKTASVFVAVHPDWAGGPVGRAGDLAVTRAIGRRDCWEKYQPVVKSIRCLGGVGIEKNDG